MSIVTWIGELAIWKVAQARPQDFTIGKVEAPYLQRWYVIPRNKFLNIYLHQMLRDDQDMVLHDHPWWNISLIIRGGYYEHMPSSHWREHYQGLASRGIYYQAQNEVAVRRRPGQVIFRRATAPHRLTLPKGSISWSIFITGPVLRNWGFWCPKRWTPWKEFVKLRDSGNENKGC
jgi:hypothetical protein